MNHLIYDGTLAGFFTVTAQMLNKLSEVADVTSSEPQQPELFVEIINVPTDMNLSRLFFNRLTMQFPPEIIQTIVYTFYSEMPQREMVLVQFIKLLIEKGEMIATLYTDKTVAQILRVSDKVGHEIHRYQGFIRFCKLPNGLYYAAIEPDYNILRFLAPHFTARFADQSWLIHDCKRKTGIYYDGISCSYLPVVTMPSESDASSRPYRSAESDELNRIFDVSDYKYQELWNEYFKQIAIPERNNPKLQRQRMPKRYWSHLVEEVQETKKQQKSL